jgi:hypothetical protein
MSIIYVTVLEFSACGFLAAFFSRPPAAIFFRQKPARRWLFRDFCGFYFPPLGGKEKPAEKWVGGSWALPPRWFLAGLMAGILAQTLEAPAGTLGFTKQTLLGAPSTLAVSSFHCRWWGGLRSGYAGEKTGE